MEDLKRFELILKQDVSEKITIEEKEGRLEVNCRDCTGVIDLDKILLDNFDNSEFLGDVIFILNDNMEIISEYKAVDIKCRDNCQLYINTEHEEEKTVKITGRNNNTVKTSKNSIIILENNNEITSGDNCKIIVENDNLIEIAEEFGKICINGKIDIVSRKNNSIILPLMNNKTNTVIVGENSNVFTKGCHINFK